MYPYVIASNRIQVISNFCVFFDSFRSSYIFLQPHIEMIFNPPTSDPINIKILEEETFFIYRIDPKIVILPPTLNTICKKMTNSSPIR